MARPIPEGFHTLTPYLTVDDADGAIRWYGAVFDAVELFRLPWGDKIGHAEIRIGDSHMMLADESPESDTRSPRGLGGTTGTLLLYVTDVDAVFARAVAAGATALRPVEDQFYGDRAGRLRDPFGHEWMLATHIEDVSPEEMERRMAGMAPEC
ncbi:VOC family protein [Sphingomonas flavalba]|uniref:VOC family protein n=1 Tax=Sphingomonas flavalba TaxID=2559804 RepID=UPI0039DF77CC